MISFKFSVSTFTSNTCFQISSVSYQLLKLNLTACDIYNIVPAIF